MREQELANADALSLPNLKDGVSRAKLMKLLLIAVLFPLVAFAGPDMPEKYFNAQNPALTQQEKAGLIIGHRWRAASATGIKPVAGADGTVQFLFGSTQPSVVCAVLQVCDIELQAGEIISNFNAGDQVRWRIEPARSGSPAGEIEHLIIKPLDVGLRTSMIITTDRRTYYLQLVSHRTEYMPRVSFMYPDDSAKKWVDFQKARDSQAKRTDSTYGVAVEKLNFNYEITGDAPFKPERVYNDGKKTILQMPTTLSQNEAPSLLVVRGEDNFWPWGAKAEQVIINYRVQGNHYIVDSIPDKMILIAGADPNQTKIVINRQ